MSAPTTGASGVHHGTSSGTDLVRPYVMTGGRVRSDARVSLRLDSQVTLRRGERPPVVFEQARIVELCSTAPRSIAELAGRSSLPVGVVNVLTADLVASGHLEVHHTDRIEIELSMLERLIERVREL